MVFLEDMEPLLAETAGDAIDFDTGNGGVWIGDRKSAEFTNTTVWLGSWKVSSIELPFCDVEKNFKIQWKISNFFVYEEK